MLTADGRQHVNWGGEPAGQRSNQSIAVSLLFIVNFKSFRSFKNTVLINVRSESISTNSKKKILAFSVVADTLKVTLILESLTGYRLKLTLILAQSLTVDPYNGLSV